MRLEGFQGCGWVFFGAGRFGEYLLLLLFGLGESSQLLGGLLIFFFAGVLVQLVLPVEDGVVLHAGGSLDGDALFLEKSVEGVGLGVFLALLFFTSLLSAPLCCRVFIFTVFVFFCGGSWFFGFTLGLLFGFLLIVEGVGVELLLFEFI